MELTDNLKPQQVAFFAQDELIFVTPNRQMDELHFLSGNVGPFMPMEEVEVPLWLALHMKRNRQCNIKVPDWLTVDYLKAVEAEEIHRAEVSASTGQSPPVENVLPFHWMEIATALLDVASSDIGQPGEVRRLIESIWMNKTSRMRKNILTVAQTPEAIASIDFSEEGLGAMEINTIKPIFVETMKQIRYLEDGAVPPARAAKAAGRRGNRAAPDQ